MKIHQLSSQNLSLQHSSTENLLDIKGMQANDTIAAMSNEGNMVKFKAFLDHLFSSGIKEVEIKKEIIQYFQAID